MSNLVELSNNYRAKKLEEELRNARIKHEEKLRDARIKYHVLKAKYDALENIEKITQEKLLSNLKDARFVLGKLYSCERGKLDFDEIYSLIEIVSEEINEVCEDKELKTIIDNYDLMPLMDKVNSAWMKAEKEMEKIQDKRIEEKRRSFFFDEIDDENLPQEDWDRDNWVADYKSRLNDIRSIKI